MCHSCTIHHEYIFGYLSESLRLFPVISEHITYCADNLCLLRSQQIYYCNICFNSPLFMTHKINETQRLNVRETYIPMAKTASPEFCTSYPEYLPPLLPAFAIIAFTFSQPVRSSNVTAFGLVLSFLFLGK